MKKWKAKLPGGQAFEIESDDPGKVLIEKGYSAFALEEITPPLVHVQEISPKGRMTMSATEAAKELGVSRPTLYTLIHRADFPSFKIGQRTLISRAGLEEWVKQQAHVESRMEAVQ
ncbi:MAG: helix-turn-helix domain-containing protein [Pseudoflavonifractor sp.]|nr:helix-turn-helix domain-containing protein [Pseudoflavonifractor sp.]